MKELLEGYKNVLLADDDSDDRDLFLEAVSFVDPTIAVTLKRDGEELMDHLYNCTATFDLIFLDLNMPRKNGKECLAELKNSRIHSKTPVIVYTTSLNPVDIEETFMLGATFFLRKPNSFEDLKEIIGTILTGKLARPGKTREHFVINRALNLA